MSCHTIGASTCLNYVSDMLFGKNIDSRDSKTDWCGFEINLESISFEHNKYFVNYKDIDFPQLAVADDITVAEEEVVPIRHHRR